MTRERILIVDDNPVNLGVLADSLEPLGYEVLAAPNAETGLRIAGVAKPDLALLDIMMPQLDGLEMCRRLKDDPATREIPVIFLTARNDTDTLEAGFRAGGIDYITKPFRAEELRARVETHCRARRLTRELEARNAELTEANEKLRREIERRERAEDALHTADGKIDLLVTRETAHWGVEGFVGKSATVAKILGDVQKLHAFGGTTVLLTGESGTGKELIARAIHHGGPRAKEAFIPVNCVAVPGELIESMFFGHRKGSFTGATADRKGYFEMADGGTLFLDEIGDMPLPLQAKLLRVLEDRVVTPVGASEGRWVDVRVIAATNVDLAEKIATGQFRQDLYYRLARFMVVTPPLRERKEDVALLATHFLEVFANEMGRKPPGLTPAAIAMLEAHPFPGNVRELKNVIERALIESGGREILPSHLHLIAVGNPPPAASPVPTASVAITSPVDLPLNVEAAENVLIQRALAQTDGNIAEAARLLGIHRTRIYRKLAQEQGGG